MALGQASDQSGSHAMSLYFFTLLISLITGAITARLTGYPLYLGLLAGWLYLSVVFVSALLPGIVMDKLEVG